MSVSASDIERCLLALLASRAADKSICPSEVARALASDEAQWRAAMPSVRDVAAKLARRGIVLITQGGETLHPDRISHGPIRLRRGAKFAAPD
jgi:hypothetical protein